MWFRTHAARSVEALMKLIQPSSVCFHVCETRLRSCCYKRWPLLTPTSAQCKQRPGGTGTSLSSVRFTGYYDWDDIMPADREGLERWSPGAPHITHPQGPVAHGGSEVWSSTSDSGLRGLEPAAFHLLGWNPCWVVTLVDPGSVTGHNTARKLHKLKFEWWIFHVPLQKQLLMQLPERTN